MKTIDEYIIGLAIILLIMSFGAEIVSKMLDSGWLAALGFSARSYAFPTFAFTGFLYRFFPLMKQSKLAKPQFATLGAGLALMAAGSAVQAAGGIADMYDFGSVIALGGIALLALIWWTERAPR
jgi:hypothetical protein